MPVNVSPAQLVQILTALAIAKRLRTKAATLPPAERTATERLAHAIKAEADQVGR